MRTKELEIFNEMPFLFWVKDEDGRYLWGNRTICQHAGEDIVGRTDYELVWAENAGIIRAGDKQVFDSGEPKYLQEYVAEFSRGRTTLNVCKWLGELDGNKRCFGLSFVIE